jgi:hypothetical protein
MGKGGEGWAGVVEKIESKKSLRDVVKKRK